MKPTRKRPKPQLTRVVTLRFKPEHYALVKGYAERAGRTVSAYLRERGLAS